jgi:hypothetical protein
MILLQQIQDIDKLTRVSLELAEAASNYGALKIIFGVFMAMMLLIVLVFVSQSVFLIKRVQGISDVSDKIDDYFEGLSESDIGKEEANSMIREVLNHNSVLIKYYIIRVRFENHISDKENTELKIQRILKNIHSEISTFLNKFRYKSKPLGVYLDVEVDTENLFNLMLEQIYIPKEHFQLSQMDQSIELFMQGLKLNYVTKIENS